jgi:hypothetical protein
LREAYDTRRKGIVVVRPDGYVGFRSDGLDGSKLLRDYLRDERFYSPLA